MGAPLPPVFLPTRANSRRELAAAGLKGAQLDAALDAGGRERHRRRVDRFKGAAFDEVRRARRKHVLGRGEGHALAIAVLVLEAFGPVDRELGPTEDTARRHHRAFRANCGARTGRPAGATHAACRDALVELWRSAPAGPGSGPAPEVVAWVSDGRLVIVAAPLPPAVLCVEDGAELAQPAAWLLAVALEGERRAHGLLVPWYELGAERRPGPHEATPSPHVLDLVQFSGELADWTALVDALDRRIAREAAP